MAKRLVPHLRCSIQQRSSVFLHGCSLTWSRPRQIWNTRNFASFSEIHGLSAEALSAVEKLNITEATEIQELAIPAVMAQKDLFIASQTGSGKTLAYLLPLVELLRKEERESAGAVGTRPSSPRVLVLVPTRELADQVYNVCRQLMHTLRFRPACFTGGWTTSQKLKVKGCLDVVIATPGRLISLLNERKLKLSQVSCVVADEADVLFAANRQHELTQTSQPARASQGDTRRDKRGDKGFWRDMDRILTPILDRVDRGKPCQFIMVSASLTFDSTSMMKKLFPQALRIDATTVHKVPATLKQRFIDVEKDKMEVLVKVLDAQKTQGRKQQAKPGLPASMIPQMGEAHDMAIPSTPHHLFAADEEAFTSRASLPPTMVFCNTVQSCRAVEHHLAQLGFLSVSYHGDIPNQTRGQNFAAFADQAGVFRERNIMVCTDIAARGLDTSFVQHVILFDFPSNGIDYLHRVGRTARAGMRGLATCLLGRKDRLLAKEIQRLTALGEPIDQIKISNRKGTHSIVRAPGKDKKKPKKRMDRRQAFDAELADFGRGAFKPKAKEFLSPKLVFTRRSRPKMDAQMSVREAKRMTGRAKPLRQKRGEQRRR